jgi:hypothetical protein
MISQPTRPARASADNPLFEGTLQSLLWRLAANAWIMRETIELRPGGSTFTVVELAFDTRERRRLSRHHSSDPRRRLIGPERRAAGQVIHSVAARASPSTCAGLRCTTGRDPDVLEAPIASLPMERPRDLALIAGLYGQLAQSEGSGVCRRCSPAGAPLSV